ncbi:MAG: PAS domain-containing protein [Sphingobacteriales bacterium]|nr:MAG: PAS domain-containing protein [Sphingobacteriales bacterium]
MFMQDGESSYTFLQGGGAMGALMRSTDWSQTTLGPVDTWPQSLRTAVGICLTSRFPMLVWWGKDLIKIYNDAYSQILAAKHPAALGAKGRDVWPEIWDIIGPMLERVMAGDGATWSEKQLLLLNRNGFPEECYFTFSYSPIINKGGKVAGVFTAVTETTDEIINERHLRTLKELATTNVETLSEEMVYKLALNVLKENNFDFPFALIYRIDNNGQKARLIPFDDDLMDNFAEVLDLSDKDVRSSCISEAILNRKTVNICNTTELLGKTPKGAWAESPENIKVVPIIVPGKDMANAVLVVGLNPHSNERHQGFAEVVTSQISHNLILAKSHEKRRIDAEERIKILRSLFGQAPVALCILRGPQHVVEIANEHVLKIWGKESDDVMNRPIFEGLPEAREQGLEELLNGVYNTGERHVANELPVNLQREGKLEKTYLNFVYEPFREWDGKVAGIIAVATDVTQQVIARKKIEEVVAERTKDLLQSNSNLERSNKELEQFAYVASHDLQEPLRKITAFGDILKNRYKEALPTEGQDMIDRMQSAASRMSSLIDDLLSFSRVSTKPLQKEQIDLNRIVMEVKGDLYTAIKERSAKINVTGLQTIYGDPLQFRQLFQNLLGNALKFQKEGITPEIDITGSAVAGKESGIEIQEDDLDKQFLQITLSDNGIGFEQQYAQKIFQIFQRLHGRMEYSGSGVGLSIVQKVVENHNGYITAEGKPGEGATFRMLFPLDGMTTEEA